METYRIVADGLTRKLPAGVFHAVVAVKTTDNQTKTAEIRYYTPHVGLILDEWIDPHGHIDTPA